jgi:hypothetical protein
MGGRGESTAQRWVLGAAAAIVVLVLAVVAGLRMGDRRDCTQIGSDNSHVSLVVPGPGWTIVEFCVSGECETTDRVSVGDDADLHPFTLSLIDDQSRTIDASGEVTTVEVRPNGEGCSPKNSFASVSVAADGTVATSAP